MQLFNTMISVKRKVATKVNFDNLTVFVKTYLRFICDSQNAQINTASNIQIIPRNYVNIMYRCTIFKEFTNYSSQSPKKYFVFILKSSKQILQSIYELQFVITRKNIMFVRTAFPTFLQTNNQFDTKEKYKNFNDINGLFFKLLCD
eukprot:TRINITY_DN18350_c0_g1_i1.p3 TRINITY_DN18350_c0_g1~~TRINITY_DN18350_c0_g1_i1.p3  ORF type:complete len:146 (+),score=1.72 TRINITY_DN18350_c0_g1_i1:692-1129(+)